MLLGGGGGADDDSDIDNLTDSVTDFHLSELAVVVGLAQVVLRHQRHDHGVARPVARLLRLLLHVQLRHIR
jgi:hypothetical protein